MGRIIDITIYCARGNNRYKAHFEEKQPLKWYGIRTEVLPPLSFFEKMSLRTRAKSNKNESYLPKFNASSSVNKSGVRANVQGTFYIGDHRCPHCGNTSYVKCHACSEWTCSPKGANQFTCAVCGNSGKISGTIDSASGNLGSGNNNKTNNKKFF